MMEMSCAMVSCTWGRWTLMATSSPVTRRALCTWATEAEPKGLSSMASKMSSMGRSYSVRRAASTVSRSMGSTSVRRRSSSCVKLGGKISDRMERICPALTKVGPSSSSMRRSVLGVRPWKMS